MIYNVFIRENEIKELIKIKNKQKLSVSCIIRVIYNCTITNLVNEQKVKKITEKLLFDYKTAKRTSIKTNSKNHLVVMDDNKKIQTAMSNSVYLYFNKKTAENLTSEENYREIKKKTNEILQKERDEFWNYTEYIKNKQRAERECKKHEKSK